MKGERGFPPVPLVLMAEYQGRLFPMGLGSAPRGVALLILAGWYGDGRGRPVLPLQGVEKEWD